MAYTYSIQEIKFLLEEIIKTKQVIAGQPIRRGRWKCNFACDTENHHLHSYCTICDRWIISGMEQEHGCEFGFGIGQIHPDMNPEYLYNEIFWSKPEAVIREQDFEDELAKIKRINQQYLDELNEESSTCTFYNFITEFLFSGRRFPVQY